MFKGEATLWDVKCKVLHSLFPSTQPASNKAVHFPKSLLHYTWCGRLKEVQNFSNDTKMYSQIGDAVPTPPSQKSLNFPVILDWI